MNLLPESRLRGTVKGVKRMLFGAAKINMEPIYCASCGKLGAYVPAENMTFAFWLCDGPCADKWGTLAGTYTSTDEAFWARVSTEWQEKHGLPMTQADAQRVGEATWGPMAKLLRESPLPRR